MACGGVSSDTGTRRPGDHLGFPGWSDVPQTHTPSRDVSRSRTTTMLPAVAPATAGRGGLFKRLHPRVDRLPHVLLHREGAHHGQEANAILMGPTSSPPATAPRQSLP